MIRNIYLICMVIFTLAVISGLFGILKLSITFNIIGWALLVMGIFLEKYNKDV